VINVSSVTHHIGSLNYSDINLNSMASSSWWPLYTYKAYANSKLALVLHAIELNARYEKEGIQAVY
jgi:NAD(P)-dependent dehydrogenase (short-subunit alcohol dehydrogenase family)